MKNIPVRHIHSTEEQTLSDGFNIRDVHNLLAGKDMIQELHRHDYYYILALEKARGTHVIDFAKYDIRNHSVFFMRPGQVHQLNLYAGSTGYLLQFNTDFYHPGDKASGQLLRRASNKNVCPLDAGKFRKILTILSYIFQEYKNKQEGYKDVIRANLGIFFIELVRNQQNRKASPGNPNTYHLDRMEEFLSLLESHIQKSKKASEYADMLNLSAFQLNAITKLTLGKTSSDVINDYILLESKRFLLATTNQVNQIASHLGYDDVSYFIRFFKKHTGYSPDAFRQNFR